MKKYSVTEAELPKRMRIYLSDIDKGTAFSAKTFGSKRASISSALRGLVDTARSRQLPERLGEDTAGAFLERLKKEGWQKGSLMALKSSLRHYAYITGEGVEWAIASGATDRRPLDLVFRAAHWAPFNPIIADIKASCRPNEIRMVDRWFRYKKAHVRVDEEMAQRFSADAASFARLAAIMTAIDPENPDNLVLQQAQRKRRHSHEGYIKKAAKLPYHDLPEPFFTDMAKLFAGKSGLSVSRLKVMCTALRRLCKACHSAHLSVGLDTNTAEAYVNGLFEDDLALRSIAGYCEFLAYFAKHAGYPREIYTALMEVYNAVKFESKTELRRKEHQLAKYPIDLVHLAVDAYTLLDMASDQDDIRNRRRDYILAGAIALLSKLQLRSFDLMHGLVGREFKRDSEGWLVDLETSKTGTSIKCRLASELTRYLDAVLLTDVAEAHLWSVYNQRIGTALFGNPAQGWKPFGKNWLWHNMSERLRHGPHIARTLIYDAVAADPKLDAVVAQALCGHGNLTSRKFYEVESNRYRRIAGINLLGAIARGLDREIGAAQQS